MLSYKCYRPFRSANYNTQHIPQTTNMDATDPHTKRSIRDRSLNRQTFGYTYVRIPYIERLILLLLFTKYTLLSPCNVTNPIFARSTRLKYKSLERINRSYKIIDLT